MACRPALSMQLRIFLVVRAALIAEEKSLLSSRAPVKVVARAEICQVVVISLGRCV